MNAIMKAIKWYHLATIIPVIALVAYLVYTENYKALEIIGIVFFMLLFSIGAANWITSKLD